MAEFVILSGLGMTAGGLVVEGLGVCAMAFYPIRRRLPASPFALVTVGGLCFFAGLALVVGGQHILAGH